MSALEFNVDNRPDDLNDLADFGNCCCSHIK
jgi:hypothetical protein